MAYSKLVFLFGLTLVSTFAGCGGGDSDDDSGDDDSSSGNSTSNSTSSGAGGTGGGSGTSNDTSGSGNNTTATTGGDGNACGSVGMGMGDSTQCSDFGECAQRECESDYAECMGEDFANGDFSGGACEDMFECLQGCSSGDTCDTGCAVDCFGDASEACTNCMLAAGECGAEACPDEYEACNEEPPTSTTSTTTAGTTGGGGGTCTDLEACCDSMEGELQEGCLAGLESAAGSDDTCDLILQTYQAIGQCTDG